MTSKILTRYTDGIHIISLETKDREHFRLTIKSAEDHKVRVKKKLKESDINRLSGEEICELADSFTDEYTIKHEKRFGRMRDAEYGKIHKIILDYVYSVILPF